MVTLIVYDLPNRDCRAKASNGEICCNYNEDRTCNYNMGGNCEAGLQEYRTEYIDVFAEIISKYDGKVEMALIIEPDSLPNMASNMSDPHCANSATAYKKGIPYAINKLHEAAPSAVMYMDAAHGGWLGWSDNMTAFARLVKDMNVHEKLRGFATNVANYQPLGKAQCPWTPSSEPDRNEYCLNGQHGSETCCEDPCNLCS
jgi:cellulose 1,4-beta-cellobiosidase